MEASIHSRVTNRKQNQGGMIMVLTGHANEGRSCCLGYEPLDAFSIGRLDFFSFECRQCGRRITSAEIVFRAQAYVDLRCAPICEFGFCVF